MTALLFDIGGTSMRMAKGTDGAVSSIRKMPTPEDPYEALKALVAYAHEMIPDLSSVSGGVAGIVEEGVVRRAAHLSKWNGFPLGSALAETLIVPIHIRNDAELAALGEAVYGAGKEYRLVGYLGIGTGIGGAHIEDKRIAPHASGFEPGHQILDIDTGATFEGLVSGSALNAAFGKPARELPRKVYDDLIPVLVTGVYNVLLAWSPDVLVLGGSLMNEENGYRIGDVERMLKTMPSAIATLPPLVHAALGDDNGLYGALALVSA
jgi:predicted NBD/HSP70 family sugar kinase